MIWRDGGLLTFARERACSVLRMGVVVVYGGVLTDSFCRPLADPRK